MTGTGGGLEVQLHSFLTSALDGGEWSMPRPSRITPTKESQAPIVQEAGWAREPV
jgi:hypothetical protein